jgi:hypothetical protein
MKSHSDGGPTGGGIRSVKWLARVALTRSILGGDQTDRFFGGREGRKPNSTRDHEQLFTVSCWHDAGRDMTCRVELGRLGEM